MKKTKKKRQIQRNFNIIMLIFSVFLIFLMVDRFLGLFKENNMKLNVTQQNPVGEVSRYTPQIRAELERVGLEQHTVTVAALMMQESKGRGGDPMQASESAGLAPNTIQDPEQSIKQGIRHFQKSVTYGEQKQVDFPAIIQAYNMGIGYIDFVAANGGKHSEELAKQFSMIQVEKNPQTYNCGGDKTNFRYPFCYGDFTYSTKVATYIQTLTASIQ